MVVSYSAGLPHRHRGLPGRTHAFPAAALAPFAAVHALLALAVLLAVGPAGAESPEEAAQRLQAEIAAQQAVMLERLNRIEESGPPDSSAGGSIQNIADTRAAPAPPTPRELPADIFDSERVIVPPDTWGNPKKLRLEKRVLDADSDGVPEVVRYVDPESGLIVRAEEDTNYDGITDSWADYEWGEIVSHVADSNDDGNPDRWERYQKGKMTFKEVDRDDDGVRDAFYRYEGNSLVEERHDGNNDGKIDQKILYKARWRSTSEQDADYDGRTDLWTTYRVVDAVELVSRIEKDRKGLGTPDYFQVFEAGTGKAILARTEEDVNGDGNVDVVSIYEGGRLIRREIRDPELVPL